MPHGARFPIKSESAPASAARLLPRVFAWVSAVAALIAVGFIHDRLPDALPVTRWSTAPRSLLLALRVPSINVLSVVLVEVLARALLRSSHKDHARSVATALFVTVGMKALIEGVELFILPSGSPWVPRVLFAAVMGGIGAAMVCGRRFFAGPAREGMTISPFERLVAALAVAGIVALQLAPVFLGSRREH